MPTFTVILDGAVHKTEFTGAPLVSTLLQQMGIAHDHPCTGRGFCGKCAIDISGDVSDPTEDEIRFGTRLSCQCHVLGNATMVKNTDENRIETDVTTLTLGSPMGHGIGAAVDIGTTTVVAALVDLESGKILSRASAMNPQRSISADVMGRISAAMEGKGDLMQKQIADCIENLLSQACKAANVEDVSCMVLSGNTTMLYLLNGRDPKSLSASPFEADTLFDVQQDYLGIKSYLPKCMHAFVGADITAAVLASGMTEKRDTALLCDIGTNGELALWKGGKLFVTSTAAGPAFEGAGISCGVGSVTGAIDSVRVEDEEIRCTTIGNAPAVGICGSGLVDAVAAFLQLEYIDETGAADEDLILADGIELQQADIRALQLAKAAIAAGIQTLLEEASVSYDEISTLYIAGGFGSHLNADSAAKIGLIPKELKEKVQVIGNASLTGSLQMLLDTASLERSRIIAAQSTHISLGGNPKFNQNYMEQMLFGDDDFF